MKKIIVVLLLLGWFGLNPAAAQTSLNIYDQGLFFYANGQYQKAIKTFQKALIGGRHRWWILQAIGDCWLKLQNPDKAMDYYHQSLKLHRDNPVLAYYVSSHQTVFNPNLKAPQAGEDNKPARGIEVSFTLGQIYFFQPSVLGLTSTAGPWQASFYLGVQPTPDWACGIQVDYLDFRPNGLDPSTQSSWTPGFAPSNSPVPSMIAGNMSVNLKVYPFSATSPFPVYLVGGGGLFVIQRQPIAMTEYAGNTAYEGTLPYELLAGPSIDGGLGAAYRIDSNARVFTEFRAVNVFLAQPIAYGTLNVGVLYLF